MEWIITTITTSTQARDQIPGSCSLTQATLFCFDFCVILLCRCCVTGLYLCFVEGGVAARETGGKFSKSPRCRSSRAESYHPVETWPKSAKADNQFVADQVEACAYITPCEKVILFWDCRMSHNVNRKLTLMWSSDHRTAGQLMIIPRKPVL